MQPNKSNLTKRQKEVLKLARKGMKPRQISERLGVGVNAVYAQLSRLRAKGYLAQGGTGKAPSEPKPQPAKAPITTLDGTVERAAKLCREFIGSAKVRKDEILGKVQELQAEYDALDADIARAEALVKAVEG